LTNALPERTNINVLVDINGTPLPIVLGEFEDCGMNEVSQTGEGIKHRLLRPLGTLHPMPGNVLLHNYDHHPAVWRLCGGVIRINMILSQYQLSKETTNPSSLSLSEPGFCALLPSRENFASRSSGLGLPFRTLLETDLCIIRNGRRGTYYPDPFIHRLASLGALIGGLLSRSLSRTKKKTLTWVPVRAYTPEQLGLTPPPRCPLVKCVPPAKCCTSNGEPCSD